MPFWAYMLHCADRTFYVCYTDDLGKRVGQDERGLIPGYTSLRRPVKLVWSDVFATRDEARQAEAQLKGWGRPKKLALIRQDWAEISVLAKGKKGASTTPDQVRGKPVSEWLHPHSALLPSEPFALEAGAQLRSDGLRLRYRLTGPIDLLAIPALAAPERADGLWEYLCFEAFVRPRGGAAYLEVNLSPSRRWAVYGFEARREGRTPADVPRPAVPLARTRYTLELSATLQLPSDLAGASLNLTGVIEEKSGRKSYWALAHPASGPPDFHDPACFTLELPPAPAE